jgi:tetratricopeptide (TPR) repeat protein
MAPVKRLRTSFAAQHTVAALVATCIFLFIVLFACISPTRPRGKSAPPEPEVPYGSMSAAIAFGRPEEALQAYEKSLAAQPQSASTRILHARLLMVAGKLPDAREEFNLILAENPRNTEALYNLSLVAGMEGQSDQREAFLRQVMAVDPGHPDALAALGDIVLARGDAAAAGDYYSAALHHDPSNLPALLGQGRLQAQGHEWNTAEALYTRAIAAEPDYPFAYVDRAGVRRSLGNLPGAIGDLSQAIALDPSYLWSYIDRGRLYAEQSRPTEAVEDFSMAIRLDPDQFESYALRADALAGLGKSVEAIADWERVARLKPAYGAAYRPLAALAWRVGDWPRAQTAFLRAYEFDEAEHAYAMCAALCALREGKAGAVPAIVEPVLARTPADSWFHDVARYLLDRRTESSLLLRIQQERNQALKARMLFYVAVVARVNGLERTALTSLTQIEGRGAPSAVETALAVAEQARIPAASGN